jgi:CHAT domain-containing protein
MGHLRRIGNADSMPAGPTIVARELVTDLFRRQAADPALTRGEALRQAMMGLLDGKGFTDENGATAFTYAHPMFWAPYSIIGDGG